MYNFQARALIDRRCYERISRFVNVQNKYRLACKADKERCENIIIYLLNGIIN